MKVLLKIKLFLFFCIFIFCPFLSAAEEESAMSYLAAGIGMEQLTYREQVPDLDLTSSDTDLTNWTLYLEGQKGWQSFFVGAKGYIPISTDEAREYWTREGSFEQTNSLTYRWTRIDIHGGYFLHKLLNPYVGISWGHSEQERSDFDNVNNPGIISETATEEVSSFSAIFGIQGSILFTAAWSFSYFAEYLLPFYSNTTNTGLPGWEASDIDGYSYAVTGRLGYDFTETVSLALQITGGRQHWEGSDWIPVGDSRAKWPENDTDFIGGFINIYKQF